MGGGLSVKASLRRWVSFQTRRFGLRFLSTSLGFISRLIRKCQCVLEAASLHGAAPFRVKAGAVSGLSVRSANVKSWSKLNRRGIATALAGTVQGWRSLRKLVVKVLGERPNFRCAPFLAANRRGNPNLSGTVCRTALACLGRRSHVRISGGTEWAPPAVPAQRLGVAHVPGTACRLVVTLARSTW